MNIATLPLSDLKRIKSEVNAAIASYEERMASEACEALKAAAESKGLSVEELLRLASRKKQKRAPAQIKYRNPANPEETWTGRGLTPRWLKREMDAGAMREDFLVSS